MRTMRVIDIRPGMRLEQALFLPSGQKVIAAGMRVTPRTVDYLRRQAETQVYLADTAEEVVRAGRATGRHRHASDRAARASSVDRPESGGAGMLQTDAPTGELDAAAVRAQTADVANADQAEWREEDDDPTDAGAAQRAACRRWFIAEADRAVIRLRRRAEHLAPRIAPAEQEVWDFHTPSGEPWPNEPGLIERRERIVSEVRRTYSQLEQGASVPVDEPRAVVRQLYAMMLNYRTRFTQLALLCPRRDDYLPDHALCVAVLAMGTAGQLRWNEQAIERVGLAALLADVGMMLVPRRIRTGGEQLSDLDRTRVQRHPDYTVALLERVADLPTPVAWAAWQHQERENGTGYPQQARGDAIHDPARVLAACDVFAALTSPRRYREHLLPYVAMEQMIRNAAAGQFHKPACRALCQAAGLFPVGSFVRLSNRHIARVVAANPNQLDRPVVQPVDETGRPTGSAHDLAKMPIDALKVERPVADPTLSQPV